MQADLLAARRAAEDADDGDLSNWPVRERRGARIQLSDWFGEFHVDVDEPDGEKGGLHVDVGRRAGGHVQGSSPGVSAVVYV